MYDYSAVNDDIVICYKKLWIIGDDIQTITLSKKHKILYQYIKLQLGIATTLHVNVYHPSWSSIPR